MGAVGGESDRGECIVYTRRKMRHLRPKTCNERPNGRTPKCATAVVPQEARECVKLRGSSKLSKKVNRGRLVDTLVMGRSTESTLKGMRGKENECNI